MKALQIALVALVLAASGAAVASAKDGYIPNYDDCHSKSVHGVWDCR